MQLHAPRSRALRAGVRNHAAAAVAARAGLGDRERALGHAHLAGAAAGRAGGGLGAGPGAAPFADLAYGHRRNADLGLEAVRRLLQRDLEVVAQIGAAEHCRAAAAAAAENLAEDVAENVAEAAHAAGRGAGAVRIDAGVAELVVSRALGRVGQDLVGLLRFLEALFGPGILRIAVRVPLHRQLAIGVLQVAVGGVPVDSEHLVIIPLRHARSLPPEKLSRSSCP